MKTKWYYPAPTLLLLLCSFSVFAQVEERGEESSIKVEFKLTDNSTHKSHSYKLNSANYSISNPYYKQDQSKEINDGSCGISMELAQDVDDFFLKWVAGDIKNASGVIMMVAVDGIKKPRSFAFTGGEIGGISEGFYSTIGTTASAQVTLYVKTLSVDGTTIFTLQKSENR